MCIVMHSDRSESMLDTVELCFILSIDEAWLTVPTCITHLLRFICHNFSMSGRAALCLVRARVLWKKSGPTGGVLVKI